MTMIMVFMGLMVALVIGGFWIALSLGLSGFLGLSWLIGAQKSLEFIGFQMISTDTSFVLVAIPLYIFMSELLLQCGITERMYTNMEKLLRGIPGGLLQTNVAASALFAACTGSSAASAATIGSISYPTEVKRGYNKEMILGSVCAGGTLGILIPPSGLMIIYGGVAGVSVGKLFLAGVIPGLIMAAFFSIYVAIRCLFDPALAPKDDVKLSLIERLRAGAGLWPVLVLIFVVLGSIYLGVATPTESAALGATLAFLFMLVSGHMSFKNLAKSTLATISTTAMIMLILMCAQALAIAFSYYGLPNALAKWVTTLGLSPSIFYLSICILFFILGMFFDGISMTAVMVPVLLPLINAYHFDLVWFGVVLVLLVEIGMLTPPVGLNLFVLQGISREPLGRIVVGSAPYVALLLLGVVILWLFPEVALVLPNSMMGK